MMITGKEPLPFVTRQDLQNLTLNCDKAPSYSQEFNHNTGIITAIITFMIIPYFQVFPVFSSTSMGVKPNEGTFLVAARF